MKSMLKISLSFVLLLGVDVALAGSCCSGARSCCAPQKNESRQVAEPSCCAPRERGACCGKQTAQRAANACAVQQKRSAEQDAEKVRGCSCSTPKPCPNADQNACTPCQNCGEMIHSRACSCQKPKPGTCTTGCGKKQVNCSECGKDSRGCGCGKPKPRPKPTK